VLAFKLEEHMLTIMQGLPDNVTGIRAQDNVTKDELDHILIPALDALVARTGEIRYLLLLDTDLKIGTLAHGLAMPQLALSTLLNGRK
jgi:hypothetical protein